MTVSQLIYASRPFGFDDLALVGILETARRNNVRDGVTGCLICREDLYLQLLEGARNAIDGAYARIMRDDRHTEITLLWSGDVDARLFPDWAMRHDPAESDMWPATAVSDGAIERATADEARAFFSKLSVQR